MKKQYKKIRFRDGLRTGLFVAVCFLSITCLLTGCGSEDKLLSELRAESEDVPGGAESGKTEGKPGDGNFARDASESEESTGKNKDYDAGVDDGIVGEAEQETSGNAGNSAGAEDGKADGQGTGRTTGGGNAEVPEKPETIYVHVCGAVRKPGVYEMPAGSRFYEAVDMAGGFAEDACQDYLNMAAPLADGSRLEIPTLQELQERESAEFKSGNTDAKDGKTEYSYYTVPETPAPESGGSGGSETKLVNINTADIAGLCALPGIGEGRAKAIIEYREKQGGFQKKEDIMQVSGIGEKMYARMEEYLAVE